MNKIYDLKLHEEVNLNYGFKAMRVPGGWIYTIYEISNTGDKNVTRTFVPFNNEFMIED